MNESVQSVFPTNKLEKRAYGVPCTNCGNNVLEGYAQLRADAQLEDLRNEVESKNGLGGSATCRFPVANGQECGESNFVTRDNLVFVEAHTVALYDRRVDGPLRG
jgi:hypothetical protein